MSVDTQGSTRGRQQSFSFVCVACTRSRCTSRDADSTTNLVSDFLEREMSDKRAWRILPGVRWSRGQNDTTAFFSPSVDAINTNNPQCENKKYLKLDWDMLRSRDRIYGCGVFLGGQRTGSSSTC